MMTPIEIQRVLPGLDRPLEQVLANRLDLFFDALPGKERGQAVAGLLDQKIKTEFFRAMLFSEWIAARVTKSPEMLVHLIESTDLFCSYQTGDYRRRIDSASRSLVSEAEVKRLLLEVKVRESVRIAWRDLNGNAPLSETLSDLSDLADACIQKALEPVYAACCDTWGTPMDRHGHPQQIIILGMGKLGAGELNFSSDIDLIFVFPEAGETSGDRHISNEEFFTRLCRRFIKMFDAASHEANFYRVDTRLRPFGDGGPLVMNAAAFEAYYEAQGREWERYAMIKARPVAGDIAQGNQLLKRLQPFIFRRYFDYGTFDSFRDMKTRITLQIKSEKLKTNIKLGQGGIREIEFFAQIFQMIRGGVEPDLQQRSLLAVLQALETHGCINRNTRTDLENAYRFLRMLENRLQAYADRQTHDWPSDDMQQRIIAMAMGYDSKAPFLAELDRHMTAVHGHFSELLVSEEERTKDADLQDLKQLWMSINDPQFEEASLDIQGFTDSRTVLNLLKSLEEHPNTRRLTSSGRKKLGRLIPLMVKKSGRSEDPDGVLTRLIDLIITIERRTCYLSLLIENKGALENLIKLASKSPWIITFLSGHPMLLDELIHPATLYSPPKKDRLEKSIRTRLEKIPDTDIEYLLEELSVFKQINTLRVAAADVSGDYPLMKVSDHLTWIAETVLQTVLEISWRTVAGKYGLPEGITGHDPAACGFIIVAYGKVGGFEMGYKSDIDLVFLYKGIPGITRGPRQIDNNMFYSNLGQRIINALTVHTAAGTLYQADMRLRPGGASGMIVSHIEAWEEYMETQAWTWEHQALIRARAICGDSGLIQQFNRIRHQILRRKRDTGVLRQEVADMRERLRKEHIKIEQDSFDLKQGPGGMVDIEFLVQFLVLNHAGTFSELTVWTDNIRLLESLETEGIIRPEEGEQLQAAYLAIRRAIHRLNLMDRPLLAPESEFSPVSKIVMRSYGQYLECRD